MSLDYFKSGLNYTLANEDTAMELALLPEGVRHICTVAGSGGRALPLLSCQPEILTCVDVSEPQLFLTELRMESVRALTHSEFLEFWGYPPTPADGERRRELFKRIRLENPTRAFFEKVFAAKKWESVLYDGKWERTFARLSRINRKLTGAAGLQLFAALTNAEQEQYMERFFPRTAWLGVISLLGNAAVFNALLYKGHFPKKNLKESHFRFYKKTFERLFSQGPARKSFFLQLVFFGKIIFADGCPIEADPAIFDRCKHALKKARIRYRQGSIVEEAGSAKDPIGFLSLSDVPSYFSGETERRYLQTIKPGLAPGARVVIRHYLRVTEGTDHTGYVNETESFRQAIDLEKVGVYMPEILRFEGT